jgi:hypothetical protein
MENCHFGYKRISLKKKTELATAAVHGLCFFEGGGGGISSNFDLKNMISTYKGFSMEKMAQVRQISKNRKFQIARFLMLSSSR